MSTGKACQAIASAVGMSTPLDNSATEMFSDSGLEDFAICVLGDLHLQPKDMPLFENARTQLQQVMQHQLGVASKGARVVQLGDVGGYKDKPGSRECFATADSYLRAYGMPCLLVVGNHDLEGEEFNTDRDNLQAWQQAFRQRHYWRVDVGPVACLGLSTTKFRSNKHSVHEIHIDDEQLQWFRDTLADIPPSQPIFVFTHAPPLGSGLKVLNDVHVKNRCAWLNQSSDPRVFMSLVQQHPNIKLWLSGHFHLSHNYLRSISVVGSCAFVSTGVIGSYNRDGYRHSRIIKGSAVGYELYTMDHITGAVRIDLRHAWDDNSSPTLLSAPLLLDDDGCNSNGNGNGSRAANGNGSGRNEDWIVVDVKTALVVENNILVEYDIPTRSPVGVVSLNVKGLTLSLLDKRGGTIPLATVTTDRNAPPTEAMPPHPAVASIQLQDDNGVIQEIIERNDDGGWYRIFQPNKWRLKYQSLMRSMDSEMDSAMDKIKFTDRP